MSFGMTDWAKSPTVNTVRHVALATASNANRS